MVIEEVFLMPPYVGPDGLERIANDLLGMAIGTPLIGTIVDTQPQRNSVRVRVLVLATPEGEQLQFQLTQLFALNINAMSYAEGANPNVQSPSNGNGSAGVAVNGTAPGSPALT